MSTLKRIGELDRERDALVEKARAEALSRVHVALDELRLLGFEYNLKPANSVAGYDETIKTRRRSGIREHVFSLIEKSENGMTRGDLLKVMKMVERNDQQAVSNALAALKRNGRLTNENGRYLVATGAQVSGFKP